MNTNTGNSSFEGLVDQLSAKLKACKTAEEVMRLLGCSLPDTPYRHREPTLRDAIWIEFADTEAPAKAKACKTAEEAMDLFAVSVRGSKAEEIYRARSKELRLQGKQ